MQKKVGSTWRADIPRLSENAITRAVRRPRLTEKQALNCQAGTPDSTYSLLSDKLFLSALLAKYKVHFLISLLIAKRSFLIAGESGGVLADVLVRQYSVRRGRLTARLSPDRSDKLNSI